MVFMQQSDACYDNFQLINPLIIIRTVYIPV